MSYAVEYHDAANDHDLQKHCHEVVDAALARAEALFADPDFASRNGWKKESESKELATIIYSKKETEGKLFSLRTELPCDPETYFHDFWSGFNETEKWNPSIAFSKLAIKIADDKDITYYGNKDMFAVKARDFVVGRGFKKLPNGIVVTVGKSIEVAQIPKKNEYVRGEILIGAGRFSPKEGDPHTTVIDYIMSIDLKGLLPKMIVNTFMAKMMLNDVEQNRKHAAAIAKK